MNNNSYRIIWSNRLNQWVVASEKARSHSKSSLVKTVGVLFALLGLNAFNAARASCPSDTLAGMQVSSGDSCNAALSTYSSNNLNGVLSTQAAGAVLNITGDNVNVVNTNNTDGYSQALLAGEGTINASGNVNVTNESPSYGSGVYAWSGSSININKNLSINMQNSAISGEGISVFTGGALTVAGDVNISDGASSRINGISSSGTINIGGNLTANGHFARDSVLRNQGGKTSVNGSVNVHTSASSNVHAIITTMNGVFEALGSDNSIGTEGDGAHALYATSPRSAIAVGGAAQIETGSSVLLASGTVHTSGNYAYGLMAYSDADNTTTLAVQTGGSIVTSGIGSIGIVAGGGKNIGNTGITFIAQQSGGSITTAGRGLFASLNSGSTGEVQALQTGGTITTSDIGSAGIYAQNMGTGKAIAQQDGIVSTTGRQAHGVVATTLRGDIQVSSAGTITTTGADANGIDVVAVNGMASIVTTGSITSAAGNAINVGAVNNGSSITNRGNLSAIALGKYVIRGSDAVESVLTTAGTLAGNTHLFAGNDSFIASGGILVGNILMGSGDDATTLSGSIDVTQASQFDGGAGVDTLNIENITLRGFTAASNDATGNQSVSDNSNLTGWETINVKNAGTLKLSDNLFTASSLGVLNVDNGAELNLKGNSPSAFIINGDINNNGSVTMQDSAADDTTTITGNYTGGLSSTLHIDTALGDDISATDKLIIRGNTSGSTTLNVVNAGGTGAQTVEGIQVVQIDGQSDGTFTLAAPVQAGSFEYSLFKNGVSTPTDGDWYLRSSFVATCANTPSMCPVVPPIYIYRPGVAAYVAAQTANADAGLLQMSTLHQRMGEQRKLSADKAQTWGRVFASGQANDGKNRFEYNQLTTGFQFGQDLLHHNNADGSQKRAGLTLQYAHSNVDARDRARPLIGLDKDTGSIKVSSLGLGGYYTHMGKNGTYLDFVGQVNHLTNKFNDSYGGKSKQHAWQVGLSAEVGKPLVRVGDWQIEPQAQLSYLYSKYGNFSDQYSNIDGLNTQQLRARLGVRVSKDIAINGAKVQYYGVANLHHDLLKPKSITLHDKNSAETNKVSERYARSSAEVGVGIQGQVGKLTYLYADARYEHAFGNRKEGAQFNVGVKSSF